MKRFVAIVIVLLAAAPAAAQNQAQRHWQPPAANLTTIGNLAAPGANQVLKADGSGVLGWRTDATGGGDGGDVDGFAANPSSNGSFSLSAWVADGFVSVAGSQTLTNKTLAAPIVNGELQLHDVAADGNGSVELNDSTYTFLNFEDAPATLSAGTVLVTQAAYNATSWNNDSSAPTRNDVRDQFELVVAPTYITQTASSTLSGEQALGALSTGLLKNTTTTGVLSIAVAGTDYLAPAAIGVTVQAFDADLTDLADGSLTGTKVAFADTNNDFAATNVQAALEELVSSNGSGPNAGDGKVHWTQLAGVPAGFADGTDDGAGGGSGTTTTVKSNGTISGSADVVAFDFLGADFDVARGGTDADISIDASIARDLEVANDIQDKVDALMANPASEAFFDAGSWVTGLGLAALYQPLDTDLTTWAGVTSSSNGRSLVSAADYSAMRTLLTVRPGTDVLAYDADYASLGAGITGLVKGGGNGAGYSAATANTDYLSVTGGSPTFGDVDASIGTIAASDPFDFAQTWNNGAITFEGLRVSVTSTANGGSSKLLALYDDGNCVSYVDVNGTINGHYWFALGAGGGNPVDTLLQRQAAHTFVQANGSTAQTFGVANTYTSDTNNELLRMQWASNVGQVGTVKGSGGGTARNLALMTDGTNRWTFGATSGHMLPAADSTYNLGASGTELLNVWTDNINGTSTELLRQDSKLILLFGDATAASTGDGKFYFPVPPEFNGRELVEVYAWAPTAGVTGTTDVQIVRMRGVAADDMLSTKLTIDGGEKGSDTAATAAAINATYKGLQTYDVLRFDVDAVSSTPPQGLRVRIGVK